MLRVLRAGFSLSLLLLALPAPGEAQLREIVSKEVSVGRAEAVLRLEFADGGKLEAALRDGSAVLDGRTLGTYAPGDALDVAWRQLLGEAVARDDGSLGDLLLSWSPPASLSGDARALAQTVRGALHDALAPRAPGALGEREASRSTDGAAGQAALRALMGRDAALVTALGKLMAELTPDALLHVNENVVVAPGDRVPGTLVVLQGDARIEGTVEGDVVILDGTLELAEGGRVEGDVRLAEAELAREGGTVGGRVLDVVEGHRDLEAEIRDQVREELRREMRREAPQTRSPSGVFGPFSRIFRGLAGVMEGLVAIFVLGLVGMGVVAFAPGKLDVVAEAARRDPGRAALVGVAGTFLLIPVWVLGLVALVITIVGIPVALAWIPLFPLAAVAAALLGYLAVAKNLGEWLADRDVPYTEWITRSSPVTMIAGGVAVLMAFFIAADVLGIVPFFGLVKGLLQTVGVLASVVATLIGFGAVLITRGGRHPTYRTVPDFNEPWDRAADPVPDKEGHA